MDLGSASQSLVDIVPHGLRWQPEILWLHVISDAFIALAYAAIPILLLTVAQRRRDLPFRWMLVAFSLFILACGATHFMAVVTIWNPLYRWEGILKLCTAIASVVTAVCLYRLLPTILKIPSHTELQHANEALAQSHDKLEWRTAELAESNKALEASNQACHDREIQFRQLADSMPHIVWTSKPDGTLDYFNERWYSFTGFDRTIFGDESWIPLLHRDDAPRRRKLWYESVRSGMPFKEEYRFWDKASGTYRWHLSRALPIADQQGNIIKWFGACTDIDDYKQAEADILNLNSELETKVSERTQALTRANDELRRTQTWLKAILDSATEVSIMALDNNGIITFFNSGSERLIGCPAEQVVGKCTPHLLYPPEQRELRACQLSAELQRPVSVEEIFLAANQPSESFVSESVYLHRDGTRIDVSLAVSPMIDANGERLGELAIAVDMRPRKALEQQLTKNNAELQEQTRRAEEANQAKTEFLSAISHEIRTPMNAILGMADLLSESDLDATQRRYVEVFRRACASLLALVNDILDLSKIESGRFELEQVDFDLNSVIDMALEMIRPKTEAKRLQLHTSITPGMPTSLIGDPLRLQQILGNLLGNAVKFTELGGISLIVRSSVAEPNRLHFEVTDTGIGIPCNKLESIFHDFTQAESSTTRRFGGTGLGLGICRRLARCMGGELRVRSTPGEGSTFYFDALFAASVKEKEGRVELTTGLAGRRVLVVDDNNTNRLIFAHMCHSWGMEAKECDNAADVLQNLQAAEQSHKPFDLVIVDRFISEGDGVQLVLKMRESYPRLPILMTTSDAVPGDQTRVLNVGLTDYAVKPVRRPELLRLIYKLFSMTDGSNGEGRSSSKPETIPQAAKFRILIVEDSEDNRFLLQEYLKTGPFEIKFAENGKLAVDLAKTQRFDLILMDMLMPVMDGLTATKLIREAERKDGKANVPLLALSANARREDIELSRAAGCNTHLSKPISRQELLTAISQYIQTEAYDERRPDVEINIPPGLEEASKRYILSRKNELAKLVDLIDVEEYDQIRRLAHNIKGTGTSYGFPDLTRIGRLMETSAKEKNSADLSAQLLELSRYLQDAEALFSTQRDALSAR